MYWPLFKCSIVCKLSNNASLCVPRQKHKIHLMLKLDMLLFRFLRLTVIKYKRVSCKLELPKNICQSAQLHKRNGLNI